MRLEMKEGGVVKLGIIAEGDPVFANQVPGRPDLRSRIEVASRAEPGAEEPEEQRPPSAERAVLGAIEELPTEVP